MTEITPGPTWRLQLTSLTPLSLSGGDIHSEELGRAPGKVVVIKEGTGKTEPTSRKPQVQENWYTHAEGIYKFKLSPGWTVSQKKMFDETNNEYDTLWSPEKDMAMVCSRSHTSGFSDAALKAAVQHFIKESPSVKTGSMTLSGAKVAVVADFEKDDGVMSWQVLMHKNSRGCLISIVKPAKTRQDELPDAPSWMLGSLVMLK